HQRLVVVGTEVHGLLIDVGEHLARQLGHTDLGVTHGRRRVAVHATEVALSIHQEVAHGEVLGHAHHGVVHRRVAVGVVLTNNVTHDAGGLLVRAVVDVPQVLHGIQNPAVHRFEAVAHVGQGAPDDDGHRVVEIRRAHLIFDINR